MTSAADMLASPDWAEADRLAGAAAAMPPEPPAPIQPYAGGAPPGSLTATLPQATAELGNAGAQQGEINTQVAGNEANAYNAQADTLANAATEKQQNAADYTKFRQESDERYALDHQRAIDAYNEYTAKAGSLKDPSSQFWEDKGTGARVLSGLAAFASGMGAGLTGQGGNPYLDFLNKQIGQNYESHKQNISDLFQKQVAAGKIADTDENWSRFQDESKLKYYDLATQHVQSTLKSQENRALGQNVKLLANKTNLDLEAQQIARRQALSHAQAMAAAQASANARARQKEMRDRFDKFYGDQPKDASDEERVQGAFKALSSEGYRDEELAPMARNVGAVPGERPGAWTLPKPETEGPGINPVTGRRYTREELDKHGAIQQKADAITGQLQTYLSDPAIMAPGGVVAGLKGELPSSWQGADIQTQRAKLAEIGSLMTSAIGSVAKDADGKPNKLTLERYHREFEPTLSDPPQVRQQKIVAGLNFYKNLARSEGAHVSENEDPPGAVTPAAKSFFAQFGGH